MPAFNPASTNFEESTFRGLLEAAPDGILVIDRQGYIVLANAQCARLLGYDANELTGQLVEALVPAYIRDRHAELRNGYFSGPRTRPMGIGLELSAACKDGTEIPVEISLSPFRHEGTDFAIAVIRDVTELRRLDRELKRNNRELQRSNEELEQFAYVASHDLQEPLRMVSGYSQLLKRRYGDKLDQEANEYIDFAVDGVKRMQALINDLLTYSRVSTRAKPFTPVNLNDVFAQTVANLEVAIEETQARVTSGSMPTVMGDATQLTQLLQNLVSNALKFHKPGSTPQVQLRATQRNDEWLIAVQDNGIGIEAAYAEKIFVIFQRLHTRDKYPGTGIGLAICKKIVERHEGRIWFESAPDQGTTFFFTLPASAAAKP